MTETPDEATASVSPGDQTAGSPDGEEGQQMPTKKKKRSKSKSKPKASRKKATPKVGTSSSIIRDIYEANKREKFSVICAKAVAKGVNPNTARGVLVRLKQKDA